MKKLQLVLVIAIFGQFISCGNKENKSVELDCLDKSEQEFLTEAQNNFESALKVYYKIEDVDKMYLDFLDGFSKMDFPPQFFVNQPSIQIIEEMNNQGYSGNYWGSNSEEDTETFLMYTNVESLWFSCLSKGIENKELINIFKSMAEEPALSPGLLATAFRTSLKDQKLNNELKMIISMTFYYQHSLMLFLNMEE